MENISCVELSDIITKDKITNKKGLMRANKTTQLFERKINW